MRKQAAGLQRDKSDLQSTLETLKSDIAKKDRSIKRFGSPLTPNGLSPYTTPAQGEGEEDEDVFGTTGGASNRRKLDASALFGQDGLGSDFADSSPDPSPSRPHLAPNHPSNEIEALKQSLAHAHRQVSMLRGTVQREKELRMDYRRKLAEAEGKAEELVDEEEEENIDPTKARSRTVRGRGRGAMRHGRGIRSALSQKLAMTPGTPDSEFLDSIDEMEASDATPEATLQQVQHDDEDEEQAPIGNNDDDISQVRDRRVSADGMDPAFANVLRNSPSSAVPLHASSPLREVTSASIRGGRRSRGGAPHLAEQRPPSLVEPAGALAAELGMTEEVLGPEFTLTRHVETAEFACQTESEPEPQVAPVLVLNHDLPPIETCEMAVQVEEVIPQVTTSEAGSQVMPSYMDAATDASAAMTSDVHVQTIPAPRTVEIDTQTSPLKSKERESIISTTFGGITRRGTIVAVVPGERLTGTDDEGEITEADTGTETEGEYTDAREFPTTTTPITGSVADFYSTRSGPQDSTADFHSVQTGPQESTSDFYSVRSERPDSDADDSDQESIKASRLHRTRTSSRTTGIDVALGYAHYQLGMHPPPSPPPRVMSEEAVQVEVKMPELKETSIQTDDWTPPPPPPPPVPPEPPAPYALFRVGSYPQQFQYIAPPTSTPSTPSGSSPQANTSLDSTSTVTAGLRRAGTTSLVLQEHVQRPSVETAHAGDDSVRTRTQSAQTMLSPLDKTRPPKMMLPPPPRMPPPPTIPDKKTSSGSMPPPRDLPPPRPTSPPPPELIQRATTPTFGGSGLLVPSRGQVRQHGASMPPSQQGLGRRPSTNSFRSAANAAVYASVSGTTGISTIEAVRRQQSTASLVSSRQSSLASRRSSVSSDHHQVRPPQGPPKPAPSTPGRTLQGPDGGTTDPAIIHAITQTMIGEFLYKYTRRVVGKGHGEKRHKRFFWVHPYTKTLYWSSADPGSSGVSESSAKSGENIHVYPLYSVLMVTRSLHRFSALCARPKPNATRDFPI
jgi:Meiotic cell cortex C-terminal pleckstrin homology